MTHACNDEESHLLIRLLAIHIEFGDVWISHRDLA